MLGHVTFHNYFVHFIFDVDDYPWQKRMWAMLLPNFLCASLLLMLRILQHILCLSNNVNVYSSFKLFLLVLISIATIISNCPYSMPPFFIHNYFYFKISFLYTHILFISIITVISNYTPCTPPFFISITTVILNYLLCAPHIFISKNTVFSNNTPCTYSFWHPF